MSKPSERIKALKQNDYRLDYSVLMVDAILDYLDEEWEKKQEAPEANFS